MIPKSKNTPDESKILSRSKAKEMFEDRFNLCFKLPSDWKTDKTLKGVTINPWQADRLMHDFIDQIYSGFEELDCEETPQRAMCNKTCLCRLCMKDLGWNMKTQQNKDFLKQLLS